MPALRVQIRIIIIIITDPPGRTSSTQAKTTMKKTQRLVHQYTKKANTKTQRLVIQYAKSQNIHRFLKFADAKPALVRHGGVVRPEVLSRVGIPPGMA